MVVQALIQSYRGGEVLRPATPVAPLPATHRPLPAVRRSCASCCGPWRPLAAGLIWWQLAEQSLRHLDRVIAQVLQRAELGLARAGFVLYGGTAIALRYGHRMSVDFDVFSDRPLDRQQLSRELPGLGSAPVLQDQPET